MTQTSAHLASAMAKLSTLDLSSDEAQAVADFLATDSTADEVSGFGMEKGQPSGFLLEVSGFMPRMPKPAESFTATDDLAKFTATDDLAR